MSTKESPAVYGAVNTDHYGVKRIGDWIQTYTGRKFHLLDPLPGDFCIHDIAHALSNVCRFTGHVSKFYSVAEHSVRVAAYVEQAMVHSLATRSTADDARRLVYTALMHDATEAYICDMARPFKNLPEFAFYREIEDMLSVDLAAAMDFDYPYMPLIKKADEVLLGTEARDLMDPPIDGWHFRYSHLPTKIRPWSPAKAKRKFLAAYYRLNPFGHVNHHPLSLFGFVR